MKASKRETVAEQVVADDLRRYEKVQANYRRDGYDKLAADLQPTIDALRSCLETIRKELGELR